MMNTMTNTYVVIFLFASFFGQSYHSRYQNFEFTGTQWINHYFYYICRFAYHLKLRALEGQGIHPHQIKTYNSEKNYHIRVVCQPGGRTEKVHNYVKNFYRFVIPFQIVYLKTYCE